MTRFTCCLAWGSVAWILGGMDWIGWMDARIRFGAFLGESRWDPLGGFSRRCFYRRSIYSTYVPTVKVSGWLGGKENARNICGVDTSSSKRASERARRFGSLVLDTTGIYAELVVCRDTRT